MKPLHDLLKAYRLHRCYGGSRRQFLRTWAFQQFAIRCLCVAGLAAAMGILVWCCFSGGVR